RRTSGKARSQSHRVDMGKRPRTNSCVLEPMVDCLPRTQCSEEETPSCFGYRVSSLCSFRFLRKGGGQDRLEVIQLDEPFEAPPQKTLLFEWTLQDPSADVT